MRACIQHEIELPSMKGAVSAALEAAVPDLASSAAGHVLIDMMILGR